MITSLSGKIIERYSDYIVLDVNGIGYKVYTTKLQTHINKEVNLKTHLHVGTDYQPSLYGFQTNKELNIFNELLAVQGIGPKIAQKIVEADAPDNLEKAILEGNINYLTKIKGLGKKGAQKIILELKNTLVEENSYMSDQETTITEALQSLGFNNKEIRESLEKIDISSLSEVDAIERILQQLGS